MEWLRGPTGHISCGAVDIKVVKWLDDRLDVRSNVIPDEPYTVTIWEPDGKSVGSVSSVTATILDTHRSGHIFEFTLQPNGSSDLRWTVSYKATK